MLFFIGVSSVNRGTHSYSDFIFFLHYIFSDSSWFSAKSHCLRTHRAPHFGNSPVPIKEWVDVVAHFNILHIIITSELLSSCSLLRSSKILIQRDAQDILPPPFIFSKDNGVFHLMGSSCGLMIPGRGHDQTVLEGIESLTEQNAATTPSCEKIISAEPDHVIVIIILCTRL